MARPTLAENLALTMLARDGIAAIWQLHLAAAGAHRAGEASIAASISEVAEAAEQACCGPKDHAHCCRDARRGLRVEADFLETLILLIRIA